VQTYPDKDVMVQQQYPTQQQQQQQQDASLQKAAAWGIVLAAFALEGHTWPGWDCDLTVAETFCALLQCSKTMTSIIHAACHGTLECSMFFAPSKWPQPAAPQDSSSGGISQPCSFKWQRHEDTRSWLSKHARLMRRLEVMGACGLDLQAVEASIAAGLLAGRAQNSAAERAGMVVPASGPAAIAAEASVAVAQLSVSGDTMAGSTLGEFDRQQQLPRATHMQGLGLPVQHVEYSALSNGSLLCSLAGSQQLTYLTLKLGKLADASACQQALASLKGLRMLDLNGWAAVAKGADVQSLDDLAPGFIDLTQLTSLEWTGFTPLSQFSASRLPVSLLRLSYKGRGWPSAFGVTGRQNEQSSLNLAHLTALTNMELGTICEGDVMPSALLELLVCESDLQHATLEPVSSLRFLRKFTSTTIPTRAQCVHLQAVSSLREVNIGSGSFCSPGHAGVGPELAKLPLVSARFRDGGSKFPVPNDVLCTVRCWTHIQELELFETHIDTTFVQLAEQLEHLADLRHLALFAVRAQQKLHAYALMDQATPLHAYALMDQATVDVRLRDMQAFVRVVSKLPKLEYLVFRFVWLGAAALELSPGPCLKTLRLEMCGLHDPVAKHALAGRFRAAGVEVVEVQ
jgi:hypothetical protein